MSKGESGKAESNWIAVTEIDPYINRGIAEEALSLWSQAKKDYMFVISQDSKNFSALYNLANVEGSTSHWEKARDLFSKAALYNPGFAMARSSTVSYTHLTLPTR